MTAAQRRRGDLAEFYRIMDSLPRRSFSKCEKDEFPHAGVYFFYEKGEYRADGSCPRVVRVGTHGTSMKKETARHALHKRMRGHYGNVNSMRGNHRGSIMRKIIGAAIMKRGLFSHIESWEVGDTFPGGQFGGEHRDREKSLEIEVSKYIRGMEFSVVAVKDGPAPKRADKSMRAYIEENAIALLSNFVHPSGDAPSSEWLGHSCVRTYTSGRVNDKVKRSGLWNNDHVDKNYNSEFLSELKQLAAQKIPECPERRAA